MISKEKLVKDLEKIESQRKDDPRFSKDERERLAVMIERAKAGYYSDYDSPIEFPCVTLVIDSDNLGLQDIAEKAKIGEYDATREESDAWYEREGKHLVANMPPHIRKLLFDEDC